MGDLPTAISTGLLAYASKDVIAKVLGPTADYVGQETKGLLEKCNINLADIFKVAYKKLKKQKIDHGQVNLRVFKDVINEGKFTEDEIFHEYFGGILACSKTPDGKDDRGIYYLSLIKNLSMYQLRLHYLTYLKICIHCHEYSEHYLDNLQNRKRITINIPRTSVLNALGLIDYTKRSDQYIVHALIGLREKLLISEEAVLSGGKVMIKPTLLGCELFLWGNGLGDLSASEFNRVDIDSLDKLFDVDDISITES